MNISPNTYACCVRQDCCLADKCHRAQCLRELSPESDELQTFVNPHLATGRAGCPYYTVLRPVRFACGFKKVIGDLTKNQHSAIYHTLVTAFGKNPYYAMRNGSTLISPDEQARIQAVFTENGVTTSDIFDDYRDVPCPMAGE